MKSTLCLLLCVLAIAGVYSEVNTTNTILVTKGILEGISTVKGWADVSGCITNNEALNAGIADAIATFSVNDTTTVTPAAIKLGKALQKIPLALRNCNNSIAITQNLVQTLSSFASLRDYVQILGNNLVTFQVDLAKGAYQANSFFNQGRLRDFGNRVGQGLAQVFLNGTGKVPPKPDANTTSLYLLIAQGVVEGASVGLRWNEVKACIKESNDSNNDIQSAIQYFQAGDTFSVAQGLAALGAALQDIPASIQDCGVSSTKTKALAQALAALEDATTYFNIVGNNVLINGIDIYDNLNAAYEAFNIGAWKVFGTNVGSATAKLFLDNVPAAKKTVGFLEIDE